MPEDGKGPPTLLLFLKAPEVGRVKTRLAASIGAPEATAVYRRLVERQLSEIPADWPVEIHHAPADAGATFRDWLGEGPELYPQVSGDLGQRLCAGVSGAFARGARAICCLGGDCPGLDASGLREMAARLEEEAVDLVFGPAEDGGYYLLGMKRPELAVFEEIPWSAPNTLEVSLRAAADARLNVSLLPMRFDVDELTELKRAEAAGWI